MKAADILRPTKRQLSVLRLLENQQKKNKKNIKMLFGYLFSPSEK